MRSKKELRRSKSIWLTIDIILLIFALMAGFFWGYWAFAADRMEPDDFDRRMQLLDSQEAELNQTIQTRTQQLQESDETFRQECEAAQAMLAAQQAQLETAQAELIRAQQMIDGMTDPEIMKQRIAQLRTEYGQAVRQLEEKILAGESPYKICYLTLDDGPTYHTQKFLDELERLDVQVTFFTIGYGIPEHNSHMRDELLKLEALGGHTIANHTFSHAYYGPLYNSVNSFMKEVVKQDELIYNVTGIHTDIVRFPCGSHFCTHRGDTIQALTDAGYGWIDWSGNAYDAGSNNYSSDHIAGTVIWQARQETFSVVLMHDWNVNTLGALDKIVTTLRAENYLFLPLFKESVTIGNTAPKWG